MSRLFHIDPTTLSGGAARGGDERTPGGQDDGAHPVREDDGAHPVRGQDDGVHPVREDDLVVFRIDGPIFFGAADRFFEELLRVDNHIRVVVLRLRQVPVMDVTGAVALRSLVERLTRRGIVVMLSAVQDQPRDVLERTGILERVTRDGDHLFDDTEAAIAHAREHLANHDHTHPSRDVRSAPQPDLTAADLPRG